MNDSLLKDVRVRQAIACAIDRNLIIKTLLLGHAKPAVSLLPPTHWAWTGDVEHYDYDPARSERLLDAAGYPKGNDGIRLALAMKMSTLEETRLLAAVLQQQLAQVGIKLELRSSEYATFYSDVTRGAFQMYSLRWQGGNEQPDIFNYAFATSSFSPKGGNRAHYSNSTLDAVLSDAAESDDMERRKSDYRVAQQILGPDLPAFNLWYRDTVVVYNKRLSQVAPAPSGSYAFLETVTLTK